MGSARGGSNPSAVARVCVYVTSYTKLKLCAWMAEWSKAVDLSSILFVGVGSNPTSGIIKFVRQVKYFCVASLVAHASIFTLSVQE